jgi:hypothetical protein
VTQKVKRKRRADWTPPPKSARTLASEREWARRKVLATVPAVPRRRPIIGISAFGLAAVVETSNNKYDDRSEVVVRFRGF